ncbi:MAG TPA: protein adenylyltransferase SelO family protein, partial [Rhodocyclaceae bacterium]|nr:protein adenylyltransferase SelO family protein [Rhodocyclaceae bacterium]
RAVLRSSVREFLCSEAMHHLGIPTTRALSLVGSGDTVIRDMFYDGHPQAESGAIVCRVAPSFVRFGNFEIHAAQGESASLKRLADYVLRHHYPEFGAPSPAVYSLWFEEIARRTAVMVAHWMRVGFVHGVMNTDNMSILGLTIDYGPYGWLEGYEPEWTPNTTDAAGRRYCYGNQAAIAYWNLQRLAMAIAPLLDEPAALRSGLTTFEEEFALHSQHMLADKLGLGALHAADEAWIAELFELLQSVETDMTLFFRGLMSQPMDVDAVSDAAPPAWLQRACYDEHAIAPPLSRRWAAWLRRYIDRIRGDAQTPQARQMQMKAANPKYVARNYLAQQAIDALELGDAAPLERLLDVLRHPYDEQPAHDDLAAAAPNGRAIARAARRCRAVRESASVSPAPTFRYRLAACLKGTIIRRPQQKRTPTMIPLRQIYEDAPAFIPVPQAFQHHRVEVTLWPLEDTPVSPPPPLTQLIGLARGGFENGAQIDAFVRAERDAWDR